MLWKEGRNSRHVQDQAWIDALGMGAVLALDFGPALALDLGAGWISERACAAKRAVLSRSPCRSGIGLVNLRTVIMPSQGNNESIAVVICYLMRKST